MEIGGIFILATVLIVVAVLGAGFYALTMWLRRKQLDPDADKIDGEREDRPRPEHVEVGGEQRARFIGTR